MLKVKCRCGTGISGCSATGNTGDGTQAHGDTQITGNTCDNNGTGDGAGIHVTGSGNRIESNSSTDNERGLDVDGDDNYVADNTVRGNTDNYDIASGNQLNILLCEVPENIDWPASVKFAGTLICTSTTTNGITVNADNVTIDMAGHALTGPGGGLDVSINKGIYQAIRTTGPLMGWYYINLRVHNGKVDQWTTGVDAPGDNNQLDHIQAARNSAYGIHANGHGTLISGCLAYDNERTGITAGIGATVSRCTSSNNGTNSGFEARGIHAGPGSTISDCSAYDNGEDGISALEGSTISDCAAYQNTDTGIVIGNGSTISGCTAYQNTDDGIWAHDDSTITGNTCDSNGYNAGDGAGIYVLGTDNRIDSNNTTDNDCGIDVNEEGNLIIRNSAAGNGTNYDIVADNKVGEIISAPNSLAISGSTGGAGVGTTNPWANFSF